MASPMFPPSWQWPPRHEPERGGVRPVQVLRANLPSRLSCPSCPCLGKKNSPAESTAPPFPRPFSRATRSGTRRSARCGCTSPRLRRRPRPALPIRLCAPGLHRPRHHVGQPERFPPAVPRGRGRAVRSRAGRPPASWSSSMPGRRTVVRSSSTPRGPAGTTPTSATRWCPSSIPITARWPRPLTAASRAIRAAGSAP